MAVTAGWCLVTVHRLATVELELHDVIRVDATALTLPDLRATMRHASTEPTLNRGWFGLHRARRVEGARARRAASEPDLVRAVTHRIDRALAAGAAVASKHPHLRVARHATGESNGQERTEPGPLDGRL